MKVDHWAASQLKTLFFYFDPHYVQAAFAKSINADFLSADFVANWTKGRGIRKFVGVIGGAFFMPRRYAICLCEGSFIIPSIARKLRLRSKKTKIIDFISSPLVYYLHSSRIKGIKKRIVVSLLREVDGFVCISGMEKELLAEFTDKPAIVAEPFVKDELVREYSAIIPALSSHNIVFVGGGPDWFYKGIDLLIAGFKIAREKVDDLKLTIVGEWEPKKEWLTAGIDFVGRQESLIPYFRDSSLYAHIGRGEAFGVSVLEAMMSGLPALVSKWTGAKTIVEKLGSDFISDIDPKDVAEKIVNYFDLRLAKRQVLSNKARTLASEYTSAKKIDEFHSRFDGLLARLNQERKNRGDAVENKKFKFQTKPYGEMYPLEFMQYASDFDKFHKEVSEYSREMEIRKKLLGGINMRP